MNIFLVFYLLLPAYFANMAPPLFAKRLPFFPMDFGLSFGRKRIFGDHKTWGGFVVGLIAALLVGFLLSFIYWPFEFSPIVWSLLVGSGALLGDAIKSFFKRRANIKSGHSWIPFDQIDYTVGAFALGSILYFPGWLNIAIVIFISAFAHVIVNHIGFYLGVRDVKW